MLLLHNNQAIPALIQHEDPPTDRLHQRDPKAYKDVITGKAKTDDGLFKVHKVEEKFFFEIPDTLLGRDILVVARLSKAPAGIGSYAGDDDKSYILNIKSFPANIEIKTVKTYAMTPPATAGSPTGFPGAGGSPGQPVTYELNTSLVILPKVPMQPRYFDDRVGYFTTQTITDYDLNPQGVDRYRFIARYRLEPKMRI
ncbi:MAG: DUF5117 domain-containing protein [Chitinophagaceae bacterium]|nr:DUF5117 domain-containing protein [Chitinophagaceae bacterium]